MNNTQFMVFSGTKSRYLAEEICKELNCELGQMNTTYFADGEFAVSYEESIRGKDVFLIQSTFIMKSRQYCLRAICPGLEIGFRQFAFTLFHRFILLMRFVGRDARNINDIRSNCKQDAFFIFSVFLFVIAWLSRFFNTCIPLCYANVVCLSWRIFSFRHCKNTWLFAKTNLSNLYYLFNLPIAYVWFVF